jgi:hypothetical protein
MHEPKVLNGHRTTTRVRDYVIECNFIIRDVLVTDLTHMSVTANDLEHDIAGHVPGVAPTDFRFRRAFGSKEDRAYMPKDVAFVFYGIKLTYKLPTWRIAVEKYVDHAQDFSFSFVLPSCKLAQYLAVPCFDRSERPSTMSERKVLYQWPVGTIFQFPTWLADVCT